MFAHSLFNRHWDADTVTGMFAGSVYEEMCNQDSCPVPNGVCRVFGGDPRVCTSVACDQDYANVDDDPSNGCKELSAAELKSAYMMQSCVV